MAGLGTITVSTRILTAKNKRQTLKNLNYEIRDNQ